MDRQEKIGLMKYFLFFGFALGMAVLAHYTGERDAMAQCQQTHSYDVCYQELNR